MKTPNISHQRVRDLLDYDEETGVFTWRQRVGNVAAGTRAGSILSCNRRQLEVDGISIKTSRLAWFYVTGEWPSRNLDHKDCNSLNDAFQNLRECSQTQNQGNRRRPSNNSSGYKGVHYCNTNKTYLARVRFKGKCFCLGSFDDPEKAHAAYVAKARELFGEFARAA